MATRSAKDIVPMVQTFFGSPSQVSGGGGLFTRGALPTLPSGLGYDFPEDLVGKDPSFAAAEILRRGTLSVSPVMPRTAPGLKETALDVGILFAGSLGGPKGLAMALASRGVSEYLKKPLPTTRPSLGNVNFRPMEAPPMFEGLDDLFGGFGDFMGELVDEVDWGGVASTGLTMASSFMDSYAMPVAARTPPLTPAPRVLAPAAGAARAGAMVSRGFFGKYPNLAAGINALRNAGKNVNRQKLWSLMKRFGPDFLISGGILTAAAVSELMMAGPGHRRMNAANAKALRRAARRIKSFHRLCQHTDLIKSRTRRHVHVGRYCGTCRKSPCRC